MKNLLPSQFPYRTTRISGTPNLQQLFKDRNRKPSTSTAPLKGGVIMHNCIAYQSRTRLPRRHCRQQPALAMRCHWPARPRSRLPVAPCTTDISNTGDGDVRSVGTSIVRSGQQRRRAIISPSRQQQAGQQRRRTTSLQELGVSAGAGRSSGRWFWAHVHNWQHNRNRLARNTCTSVHVLQVITVALRHMGARGTGTFRDTLKKGIRNEIAVRNASDFLGVR